MRYNKSLNMTDCLSFMIGYISLRCAETKVGNRYLRAGKTNHGAHSTTRHLTKLERSVDHASKTLSSNQTSRNSESVRLEVLGEILGPPPGSDGAEQDGVGVAAVGTQYPSDTNRHPVGEPLAELLTLADEVEVLEDGLEYTPDAHDNREDAAAPRDGE